MPLRDFLATGQYHHAGSGARHRGMSFRHQVIVSAFRNSVASGERSLLARTGPSAMSAVRSLSEGERTSDLQPISVAIAE